ncbi:hypothetical protein J2X85_004155 [Microbacterium trichothecenolyticum]|uniref:pPIWI-associating nuclease domain-containing protein n=1 Tax=Microbacterium trichothecenolyticum TaxID=69370 RepID=UPI00285EC683|nr:hypothetical protein [Microbacterium trichothecenolyticum]MDR7187089.1 hypothetical protein [Microbacterium trichothecenolyticum]
MARRITPAQARSLMRQAQQKQQQQIRKVNSAIDKYNRDVKKAVNDYNREARAHNARTRSNRARLQSELRRLNSTPAVSVRYTTSTRVVHAVEERFTSVESAVESGRWDDPDNLLDLAEAEAADSVASLNRLLSAAEGATAELQATTLTSELMDISPDLQDRWSGGLFALNPANPDAARHFCTSAREMMTSILDAEAPDYAVIAADPDYIKTPNGGVSRRAKIRYCLAQSGNAVSEMVEFVDADINGVIALFDDFNHGTHGAAGRFPMGELIVLKERVEQAVKFIHRLVRG